jgi:hypothetical protein
MENTGPQKAIIGAIIASVIAFLTAILAGLQGIGSGATLGDLTAEMWISAVIAFLASAGSVFGGVYYTQNHGAVLAYSDAMANPVPETEENADEEYTPLDEMLVSPDDEVTPDDEASR